MAPQQLYTAVAQQSLDELIDAGIPVSQMDWDALRAASLLTPLERARMEDIKRQLIDWHKAKIAAANADEQMQQTAVAQAASPSGLLGVVNAAPLEHVELILKLLSNIHQDDVLKNVLFITDLLFEHSPQFLNQFHVYCSQHRIAPNASRSDAPYMCFLRILQQKQDLLLEELATRCLTRLFCLLLAQRTSTISEYMLFAGEGSQHEYEFVESFISWLVEQLKAAQHIGMTIVTQPQASRRAHVVVKALMDLLRFDECRVMLYSTRGGIAALIALERNFSSDVQMLYQIGFCFWMLSYGTTNYWVRQQTLRQVKLPSSQSQQNGSGEQHFDVTVEKNGSSASIVPYVLITQQMMFQDENIIPRLHDMLKVTQKEKVIRVVLACMKRLADAHRSFITDMVQVSVPKTLQNLMKRNFEDKDISEDLKALLDATERFIEEISSFDEYRQEVLSGRLQWSPVHDSEKFWKENLNKFEQNNFFIVREIIKLLGEPQLPAEDAAGAGATVSATASKTTTPSSAPSAPTSVSVSSRPSAADAEEAQNLAIACHDLGMFVQYFPRGKRVLTELGAKPKILALMEHPNPDVRKHALTCTMKLMVQNWQYLQQ